MILPCLIGAFPDARTLWTWWGTTGARGTWVRTAWASTKGARAGLGEFGVRADARMINPDDFDERRYHQANGMGGMPVVGDPDGIARELAEIAAAGARGIALSFVNYGDELPFFRDEVLPRLARMGLRQRY